VPAVWFFASRAMRRESQASRRLQTGKRT
jgi:hypothetical protein